MQVTREGRGPDLYRSKQAKELLGLAGLILLLPRPSFLLPLLLADVGAPLHSVRSWPLGESSNRK